MTLGDLGDEGTRQRPQYVSSYPLRPAAIPAARMPADEAYRCASSSSVFTPRCSDGVADRYRIS
ncbi:hypothetical protein ADK66_15120 [Micromonospora sp. NRRL B-16802]|nr:hypothetical protein ADK66_15120 [Micromonospora sp. NRRL B-16802]